MIPAAFHYHTPASLEDALSLLRTLGSEAKVLTGGQSLLPMMKLRLAEPEHVIDLNHIPGLAYIREEDGELLIGALTREADVEASDVVRQRLPILRETSSLIADPQVRNLGTLAGNLAHGDPGNDHPATMLALGARVVATGPFGAREIPVTEFFVDFYTTALADNEIITEIRIPLPPPKSGGAYLKLERKVGDYATVGVAAQLSINAAGRCTRAGIGLTNVSYVPVKATEAEDRLTGSMLTESDLSEAAALASAASSPSADLRGSEEYKRAMVRVLTHRALRLAAQRA